MPHRGGLRGRVGASRVIECTACCQGFHVTCLSVQATVLNALTQTHTQPANHDEYDMCAPYHLLTSVGVIQRLEKEKGSSASASAAIANITTSLLPRSVVVLAVAAATLAEEPFSRSRGCVAPTDVNR